MDTKTENSYKKLLVYTKNSDIKLHNVLKDNILLKANLIQDHKIEIFVMILMTFFINIRLGIILMMMFFVLYMLYLGNKNYIYELEDKIEDLTSNDDKETEKYLNCRASTMNNPYGNYLIGNTKDISYCDDEINNKKAEIFNKYNIYENASNKTIGSSNKSDRSFYTTPNSSVINSIKSFKDFLKSDKLTCKIDGYCLMYDDLRFHVK